MTPLVDPATIGLVTFAERLRELRHDAGLTQTEAAAACGMSVTNWSAYETGRRPNPGLETMLAMARGLGVEPQRLLEGVDQGRT